MARFGSLAKLAERRAKETQETSALSQRSKVIEALSNLDRRVLVIVDDLDRIEPEQIRDVVRLIKLVGDFPNVTYLLAYDSRPRRLASVGTDPRRAQTRPDLSNTGPGIDS